MLYSSKRQGLRPPIMARKMKHTIAFPNYVSTVVCFLWICSIRFLTRLSRLGLHITLPPATVQLSSSRFCSPKPPHDPKENPPNSPEMSSDNPSRNLQDPTDMRSTVTQTPAGVVRSLLLHAWRSVPSRHAARIKPVADKGCCNRSRFACFRRNVSIALNPSFPMHCLIWLKCASAGTLPW